MRNFVCMIEFVYYTGFTLQDQKPISEWLLSLAHNEGYTIKKLLYNYISADQIQSLNNEFLNHNYPTDVIAFDYCEGNEISGEVFICQKEVEVNASIHSQSVENETLRVLCHALFHLCGYNDKTDKDQANMRSIEDRAIASFQTRHK